METVCVMSLAKRKVRRAGAVIMMAGLATLAGRQVSRSETPQPAPAPAVGAATSSQEEADGIIFERQQLMLQLDRDAKTLGMIAAGSEPTTKLAETTRSIAQGARDSVTAFNQVVPGGRAKPEVWSSHAAFMQDMETFARNAEGMAKAGEGGNLNAVTNLMIDALPCKQCHDRYRGPKPS
jgi:cytochrome c556